MAWFVAAFNKEPAMVLSAALALGAVALPFVIVPARRAANLPTYQWDADPATHPVRCAPDAAGAGRRRGRRPARDGTPPPSTERRRSRLSLPPRAPPAADPANRRAPPRSS
jgi:hypothetical protein